MMTSSVRRINEANKDPLQRTGSRFVPASIACAKNQSCAFLENSETRKMIRGCKGASLIGGSEKKTYSTMVQQFINAGGDDAFQHDHQYLTVSLLLYFSTVATDCCRISCAIYLCLFACGPTLPKKTIVERFLPLKSPCFL